MCPTGIRLMYLFLLLTIYTSFAESSSHGYVSNSRRVGRSNNAHAQVEDNTVSARVCLTKPCVLSAASILKNLDASADPCKDFYQFACGGYEERTVIPEDKTSMSLFQDIDDELSHKLKSLLDDKVEDTDLPATVNAKNLYKSCFDTNLLDRLGKQPLTMLIEKLGGWPVLEGKMAKINRESESSYWNIEKVMSTAIGEGVTMNAIVSVGVVPDMRNSTNHILEVDQPTLGMPDRSYLLKGLNDSLVQAYYKLMVEVAVYLGADREIAENDLLEMLEFEIKIANLTLPREERHNFTAMYNKMTIQDLNNLAPAFNWKEYFNGFLPIKIEDDEPIIVDVPKYITQVVNVVQTTSNRTLNNYLLWRIVLSSLSYMDSGLRKIRMEYVKKMTGQEKEAQRWETCVDTVSSSLGAAVGSLYVRKVFDRKSKQTALEVMNYLQQTFNVMLESNDWMDDITRERALSKAASISRFIAYPDELLNDTIITDYYQNLTTNNMTYYFNILHVKKFASNKNYAKLRKPVDKKDWVSHGQSAVVNAFYNPVENSITFPAGILQGMFFDSKRPNYLNFGAIGFVIGHEITHGFDHMGRQFDSVGNLKQWWEPDTEVKFTAKAQCIINQYSNYTVPEIAPLKINGKLTQGENIADIGGLRATFKAYESWIKSNGEELSLPGLDYTTRQLFWISAANVWCGKQRPQTMAVRVLTDSHSPARFRVNGPLSNMEQFSKDYSCPSGSPMNPINKCSIW